MVVGTIVMVMESVLNEILTPIPQLGIWTSHQTGFIQYTYSSQVIFLNWLIVSDFRSPIHGSYSSWNNSADNQSAFEARVEDGKLFYEKRW